MRRQHQPHTLWIFFSALVLSTLLLAGCDSAGTTQGETTTQTQPKVNVFGSAANHPHSLLALSQHILLLATHYGLFRSADDGQSWKMVAGGPGQAMEGLMTYSMVKSPLNEKRVYVLAQFVDKAISKGTPGLYSSSDGGQTWQPEITTAQLKQGNIFLAQAGSSSADEVYLYLNTLGKNGLQVSQDKGQHFQSPGALPFGSLSSLITVPGQKHTLLAASSDGLARSEDDGQHWSLIKGTGGIYELTASNPGGPLYASGDDGVYVSQDGGKTFQRVYSDSAINSLSASPLAPQTLYGKTGTALYRSQDGGKHWNKLPALKGNYFNVVASPYQVAQVYISLSYPAAVYRFDQDQQQWTSLTPKA